MGINQFCLNVATVNGSGSQSSNNILVRSLFRMGLPVGGKNMFPSNIAGLPTWYTIRVSPQGYTGRLSQNDIVVAMNPATALEDQKTLKAGGCFIYNEELKIIPELIRKDVTAYAVPFRQIVDPLSDSVKLKKLLTNMVYAGLLSKLLEIPDDVIEGVVTDTFKDKPSVIGTNQAAIRAGRNYATEHLSAESFPYKVQPIPGANQNRVLIDGNTASAMGLLQAGCTFVAWYPITPSSSLVERFESYAQKYRRDSSGKALYSVIQAEDELASICMVIGAGWAGARAMTATSGPGLSLMAEAAGLAYYAEIPAVIWDVQRVGPSTGLPTRTMQGDLLSAYTLSHGDTKHVVLLPKDPKECFELAPVAFDLAETLQTLVIVLTDLDIGMNQHIVDRFQVSTEPFQRGKVLSKEELDRGVAFARYKDVDGDGIGYRTLPGTAHEKAAFFTRGTGHDENAKYSENAGHYKANMERLKRKFKTAQKMVPAPEIKMSSSHSFGVLYYGSTDEVLVEALAAIAIAPSTCRLRALPVHADVERFIETHQQVLIVEQNRDEQLRMILCAEYPQWANKFVSITQYDGLPMTAEYLAPELQKRMNS